MELKLSEMTLQQMADAASVMSLEEIRAAVKEIMRRYNCE